MKMKFVYALLLLMLVVTWAYPDYNESNDDDVRSKKAVQISTRPGDISQNYSESDDDDDDDDDRGSVETLQIAKRTGDTSRNNSDDNRMVTKVRRKRGLFRLIPQAAKLSLKLLVKHVPRSVSPFWKIVVKAGKALEYVELGITIVQAITDCPTPTICSLKENVKTLQGNITDATKTLNHTHARVEECTAKTNRVYHTTQLILKHIDRISQSLVYITDISELRHLENMNFICAKENGTKIRDCLENSIHDIEFVYSQMENRINQMKLDNLIFEAISFVAQRTLSAVIGTISLTKQNYNVLVSEFSNPKRLDKFKLVGKAIKSSIKGSFTSFKSTVLSPLETLKSKFRRVSHKMRSLKHRVLNTFVHRRQQHTRLLGHVSPRKFSVSSVLGKFAKGAMPIALSAISFHLRHKQYEELEDDLRKVIHKNTNDLAQLNELIAEGSESSTNCTQYLDYSVGLFRNVTRTVVETLGLFDDMTINTTVLEGIDLAQSEIKTALYRNVSAIFLGGIDHGNIHVKQDELLNLLKNDYFNMTEMKSWVKTENALFKVVQEGINDGGVNILRMCDRLQNINLHTAGRENWPIQDVLCNLALFHPSHQEFDYYNMDEIREYCKPTPVNFPLNNVLLHRKNTLVQETIRRYVESSEEEDPAKLADKISQALRFDNYMQPLGKLPAEKEVLCIIADMFPHRFKYAFYDLADFRLRSDCSLLTTEKFEELELHAIDMRNEMRKYQILLSPAFFNSYLNEKVRGDLEQNVPVSLIFQDIRRDLTVAEVPRNDNWPLKEILCVLGTVAPLEMYVYDHYPLDVIRNRCQEGTMPSSQLQDILLKRKETLLELDIRRYVDYEAEENPEAMVEEFADLLNSDPIMEALDIRPSEHEVICMVADLYPSKGEYGMYRLNQFRPMEVCEQISEQEFQFLKEERERRKFEAMLSKYCSDSNEPCFPMTRPKSEKSNKVQKNISQSGSGSSHATSNMLTVLALSALMCIL